MSLSSPPASYLATQILIRLRLMPWRLASGGDSPPRNSWTTCRLNSIECVRCLAMGFLLESPVQLTYSQVLYLSHPKGCSPGAAQRRVHFTSMSGHQSRRPAGPVSAKGLNRSRGRSLWQAAELNMVARRGVLCEQGLRTSLKRAASR